MPTSIVRQVNTPLSSVVDADEMLMLLSVDYLSCQESQRINVDGQPAKFSSRSEVLNVDVGTGKLAKSGPAGSWE